MSNFEITTIQFFDQSFENQIGENEYETVRAYSANIAINDSFIIQLTGNDEECSHSIPTSNEQAWNDTEAQDKAYETVDASELMSFLESQGVENNYDWLSENADEVY